MLEIFQKTYFEEHMRTTASIYIQTLFETANRCIYREPNAKDFSILISRYVSN